MEESAEQARSRILDKVIPDLEASGFRPVGNNILLAVYDRAGQKTAGGIIIAETKRDDEFQGKVGLVLALGNMCSEERSPGYDDWFGEHKPRVRGWVGASIRDCQQLIIGDTPCRLVPWGKVSFVCNVHDLAF